MNDYELFLLNILNVLDGNNIQDDKERGHDDDEIEIVGSDDASGIYQH